MFIIYFNTEGRISVPTYYNVSLLPSVPSMFLFPVLVLYYNQPIFSRSDILMIFEVWYFVRIINVCFLAWYPVVSDIIFAECAWAET